MSIMSATLPDLMNEKLDAKNSFHLNKCLAFENLISDIVTEIRSMTPKNSNKYIKNTLSPVDKTPNKLHNLLLNFINGYNNVSSSDSIPVESNISNYSTNDLFRHKFTDLVAYFYLYYHPEDLNLKMAYYKEFEETFKDFASLVNSMENPCRN